MRAAVPEVECVAFVNKNRACDMELQVTWVVTRLLGQTEEV